MGEAPILIGFLIKSFWNPENKYRKPIKNIDKRSHSLL
jgi:hypothetical protein